ncbi:MAG: hypothetical protein ICV60_05355 [Pyrinomonadaceae bacterium]|nr:hypothetical protein [Pyrinomonadaceae bacterium]
MPDNSINPQEELLESVLEAARPLLFRANAFRLLGLHVFATEPEIKKESDKARMMGKFGGRTKRVVGPLPLDPPPESASLLEAAQRLRDPELRLIDEFFWFWPANARAGNDEAPLAALIRRDVESATRIWKAQEDAKLRGLASHNLALMFHTLALDIENARHEDPLAGELKTVQEEYWRKGLAEWQSLLSDEGFWELFAERVIEQHDPRVPENFAERFKATLPAALLLMTAQLALSAAGRGASQEAELYGRMMSESGFGRDAMEESCARVVKQVDTELQALCKTARSEALAETTIAHEVAGRLLQQSRASLDAIGVMLPADDPVRNRLRDEVAAAANDCLMAYCEGIPDWKAALELVGQVQALAVSLAVRARTEDLRIFLLRFAYR